MAEPTAAFFPFVVPFDRIESLQALSFGIGCTEAILRRAIDESQLPVPVLETTGDGIVVFEVPDRLHSFRQIPKRNRQRQGEFREVVVVQNREFATALKVLAQRLERYLLARCSEYPSPETHGFLRGRCARTNAEQHLGARHLAKADIRNFFPTITASRVCRALIEFGQLTEECASLLSKIVTVRDSLPLGYSTSPLLANLVCLPLDAAFRDVAHEFSAKYTRYADDLTFSGDSTLPSMDRVSEILTEHGFEQAEHKWRVAHRGQRQCVTGLSISDPRMPRVPKHLKRKLRQQVYLAGKFGIQDLSERENTEPQTLVNRVTGMLAFAVGVEPHRDESEEDAKLGRSLGSLRASWNRICTREGYSQCYGSNIDRAPRTVTLVFDESTFKDPLGDTWFSLACVELDDPGALRGAIQSLAKRSSDDPFFTPRAVKFAKRGFHFSDDLDNAKTEVCNLLSTFPLRAFVVFCKKRPEESFLSLYTDLFGAILPDRIRAAHGRHMELLLDSHNELTKDVLNRAVEASSKGLEKVLRSPVEIVRVATPLKAEEPLLVVPDYLLGVFQKYATSLSSEFGNLHVRRFEQLREKYRLIVNRTSFERFNRGNPFRPLGSF